MKYFLNKKYIMIFLALVFVSSGLNSSPSKAQLLSTPQNNITEDKTKDEEEIQTKVIEPPEVIVNDQKIIFKTKPILDEEGWLFPFEEIAAKLQDKVRVDLVNGIILIERSRDKSIVELNIKNGIVMVNNRPFKTLFGYNRIILGPYVQMVPTSALVILLGLTSYDEEEDKLVLKNTIGSEHGTPITVQPPQRTSFKDLLVDYLTVTNSFNFAKEQELLTRNTEINSAFYNDNYSISSDLLLKAGTNAPIINFDTGNFSFYKNNSPFQVHIGDKPLSLIKSPLLGGITLRGVQVQTSTPIKDSRLVFSSGLLASDGKILGKGVALVKYSRLAEIIEWSSSPTKSWQFSVGEATYTDLKLNQLVRGKQTGGLLALSATKTGKFVEADSNLAFGITNDKKEQSKSGGGFGTDLLVRMKPKDNFSIFTKGAYYSPSFFSLSGNPYYHDRNEATIGIDIALPRSNIGISHSIGKSDLNAKKQNDYKLTNVFATSTPIKNGPTIVATYSKNQAEVSSTRAIDNLLFPINKFSLSTIDLETLIERRTNSFFRLGLFKSWKTINFSSSINHFTFANETPLLVPILGKEPATKLLTYDLNVNKYINRYLSLQNYIQGSDRYKQIRFGINLSHILNDKLNILLETGTLLPEDSKPSPTYGFNANYAVNKKNQVSLNFDKTAFLTSLSGFWQYNMRGKPKGPISGIHEVQNFGKIRGRVIVLEESPKKTIEGKKIVLPGISRERGIANIRVQLGNYIITTNENGEFEFPSLTPGTHRLKVEYSDLPSYLTSITPEAIDVKVVAGKESNFNFVLAYFGSVSGKVQLAKDTSIKLEQLPELQDIRVYLDGTEFETLTNIDGTFVLGDIKPGKYKLKVDPKYLPEDLQTDTKGVEIEVYAKDRVENIQLPIKFKTKEIQIQEF